MTITNVLLHLDRDARNREREKVAFNLARTFQSHVTGLFILPPPPAFGYADAYVADEIIRRHRAQAQADANKLQGEFEHNAKAAAIASEFRLEEGQDFRIIAFQSRYADLIVVGQSDPDDATDYRAYNLPEEVVMIAGRPMLTVPYAGTFDSIGKRVMVAWNASRESARSLSDAMPFLKKAEHVDIYCVNPPDTKQHIPGADIATHLARHGVTVEAHHTIAKDVDAGNALLSAAYDLSSDLIVMGAYGHTRLRELALGGVTRYLLRHMTVPVLFSH